ncbi:MAG: dihydrofolate reductase family protein [Chloroflexota bacterium]
MHSKRKTILYIAASLDGFIAAPGDDLSFLDIAESKGEDYGYGDFVSTVDTIVMGRKTYDWVMKNAPDFVHADKETYIITRTPRPPQGSAQFYTGNLKELIEDLKSRDGKNIFIDGGAEIVRELLKEKLIDEFIVFIIPVLLGAGVRLFLEGFPGQELKFVGSMEYKKTGVVGLMYKRKDM